MPICIFSLSASSSPSLSRCLAEVLMAPTRKFSAAEKRKAPKEGPDSPPPKRGHRRPRKYVGTPAVAPQGHRRTPLREGASSYGRGGRRRGRGSSNFNDEPHRRKGARLAPTESNLPIAWHRCRSVALQYPSSDFDLRNMPDGRRQRQVTTLLILQPSSSPQSHHESPT